MKKILIVDDSDDLLEALTYFLQKKDYEVKCITNAQKLLPVIEAFLPDLIILDIYLKGDDGREICKKLRSSVETKYLCIILFSSSSKDLKSYKAHGADNYIEKPFGLNELLERVEATLETCHSTASKN
jgi:DNA-binding response OmpR family regulator